MLTVLVPNLAIDYSDSNFIYLISELFRYLDNLPREYEQPHLFISRSGANNRSSYDVFAYDGGIGVEAYSRRAGILLDIVLRILFDGEWDTLQKACASFGNRRSIPIREYVDKLLEQNQHVLTVFSPEEPVTFEGIGTIPREDIDINNSKMIIEQYNESFAEYGWGQISYSGISHG